MTREEFIQKAIDSVKFEWRRRRLQEKFDANPTAVLCRLSAEAYNDGSDDCNSLAEFLMGKDVGAIDPEKLKRWIEFAKLILPLILALL